ncbi:MAPEG family protein [uncultured Brevundimonas sp.]|uniref:MAPEG family protein n=1 Tax=uncultured Brevundimonas sp. TaxID=213418 RepID=UPI0030ECC1D0|tara:strand:+ start:52229 stop:52648 length:420 start_codon:yes stop_codon:yes gene_type:complete
MPATHPMEMMSAIQAAGLWAGVLILILLALSGLVVRRRQRHQIAFGDAGNVEMTAAARAFGNASEYIPAGLIALVLLALIGAPAVLIHAIGVTLVVGRLVHALGLVLQTGPSLGRVLGMLMTWIALLVGAVSLIAFAVI